MARFLKDADLDYDRLRTPFASGEALMMDESYRRAHLPLVNPGHPAVIAADPGRGYAMGRHETVWSLVAPVAGKALEASAPYQALLAELRAGPLAAKFAWDSLAARRSVLHATICGSLGRGATFRLDGNFRAALAAVPRFRVQLVGLFSGNLNLGRLYLPLYPERTAAGNPVHRLQAALGRPPGNLYVVGLFNLTDDLDAAETAWLGAAIERWRGRVLLEWTVDRLDVLGARDDLALDSDVAESVRLG